MTLVLGLDIGTTSTIGIVVDTDGAVLALAERPVDLHSAHPGWAEEDPRQWWANSAAICRELIARCGRPAAAIAAIGVTGMVPALVALDKRGEPVRRSIQQSDARTATEVAELTREVDARAFLARTGAGVNQQLIAPKLRWLARHEPEAFAAIATLFGSYDYIAFRLTGVRTLERNWALEAGFVDLATGQIADDLVALGKVSSRVLPPLKPGHAIIGAVTAAAATDTGLAAGTPVIAGVADHVASAFAAGVRRPGDLLIKFGGAGDVLLATPAPQPDARLFLDYHIVPGLFMPNGCMAASGSVLNWFVRELAAGELEAAKRAGQPPHARLDALAANVSPGSEGLVLLPYFLGEKTPIHDANARGVFIGLGLHHRLGHLWRAALEGIAFGFRHHVEVCLDIGYPVARIVASDGGAKSAVWMQIVADVLQRPVGLLEGHPGSCLGAAYVAAYAIGAAADWDGIERFVRPARAVEPNRNAAAAYDAAYEVYRATYEALRPIFPGLAALDNARRAAG